MSTKDQSKEYLINDDIRAKEVRLIDETGNQVGVMPIARALEMSDRTGLDLILIAPKAEPPVCRIADYGKFRFDQMKKEKEAKKNQKVVEIKEIRFSPKIDVNDFNTKLKAAQKFLTSGNKVKVSVRFRGREMAHTDIGLNLLVKFAEGAKEFGVLEKEPKLEGRQMIMFLAPDKKK